MGSVFGVIAGDYQLAEGSPLMGMACWLDGSSPVADECKLGHDEDKGKR